MWWIGYSLNFLAHLKANGQIYFEGIAGEPSRQQLKAPCGYLPVSMLQIRFALDGNMA